METKIFYPDEENIQIYKKIIKEQGVSVCHNQFEKEFISTSLHKASFGIVIFNKKAQVGKKRTYRSDELIMKGFILCRIDISMPNIIWIDLVCSKERSKLGKQLLQLAEIEIEKNKEIKLIQLLSIPDVKLKNWYTKLGYGMTTVIMHNEYKPKAYQMVKFV